MSRFHLFQGAIAFLLSPAWFALIAVWALVGALPVEVGSYFNAANPLFPVWPGSDNGDGLIFLGIVYAMLLTPKLMAAFALGARTNIRKAYGGWGTYLATTLTEILLSIIYAPILMVQQTVAVARVALGWRARWTPQHRSDSAYSWSATARFHAVETVLGLALLTGMALGAISLWLLPVAVSLIAAIPLSRLGSVKTDNAKRKWARLDSPTCLVVPPIVARAAKAREDMRCALTTH